MAHAGQRPVRLEPHHPRGGAPLLDDGDRLTHGRRGYRNGHDTAIRCGCPTRACDDPPTWPPYDHAVIEAQVYRQGAPPEAIDADDIDVQVAKHDGVLWVDVTDATHEDFGRLAEEFSLNSYAIEDAVHERERPKVERFDTHAFMVMYDRDLAKVSVFLGSCWVISVRDVNREGHCWDTARVRKNFPKEGMRLTPGQLVYRIVDDIVDGYEDR